jgi:hypothetical protein
MNYTDRRNRVIRHNIKILFLRDLPFILVFTVLLFIGVILASSPNNQLMHYGCYAKAFWYGPDILNQPDGTLCKFIPQIIQFRTFPLEYPPFSLILFSIPLLFPFLTYPIAFVVTMAFFVLFLYWIFIQYCSNNAGYLFAILLLLASFGSIFYNFDIVPAITTLLSLIMLKQKHWTLAYISLGVGVLIKVYPLILLPILFIYEQLDNKNRTLPISTTNRPRNSMANFFKQKHKLILSNGLIFLIFIFGVTFISCLVNTNGALNYLKYFVNRPFEDESLGCMILWLISILFKSPVKWVLSYGSLNIISPYSNILTVLIGVLFLSGYVYLIVLLVKDKIKIELTYLIALLLLISTNKVFSPQFLIWLIPMIAFYGTGNKYWWIIWGSICLLTTSMFPGYAAIAIGFGKIEDASSLSGLMLIGSVRDGLIFLMTLSYLFNWFNFRKVNSNMPNMINTINVNTRVVESKV